MKKYWTNVLKRAYKLAKQAYKARKKDEFADAALLWAIAAGWLLVMGKSIRIPGGIATTAGAKLLCVLPRFIEDILNMEKYFDENIEGHDFVISILEERMDIWVTLQILLHTETVSSNWSKELHELNSGILNICNEIDILLHDPNRLSLLSMVATLQLLDNWRNYLTVPYKYLPWWLDGTLEKINNEIERDINEYDDVLKGILLRNRFRPSSS